MILLRFEIDAGVFDGLVRVAAGDFDCEAGNRRGRRRFFWSRGLLRGRRSARGEAEKCEASRAGELGKLHGCFPNMLAGKGVLVKLVEELKK